MYIIKETRTGAILAKYDELYKAREYKQASQLALELIETEIDPDIADYELKGFELGGMNLTRPKGYSTKVWEYVYKREMIDVHWAKKLVKTPEGRKWFDKASDSSIERLGKLLCSHPGDLAKESYDYLEMRAHGETFLGALDPCARSLWVELTGKKINPKKMWKYDHTKNITSNYKVKGTWVRE